MSNQIQFELASPQRLVFNKPVAMVTIPGSEGVFGVLPGHALMDAGVGMGVVEIYENDQNTITEHLFVTGGFCEVTDSRCTLMADQVIPLKNLNRAEIEDEIKLLTAENAALRSDEGRDELDAKLEIAQAKLQALAA